MYICHLAPRLSWELIQNKMVMTISPTALEEHYSRMQTYLGILNYPTGTYYIFSSRNNVSVYLLCWYVKLRNVT